MGVAAHRFVTERLTAAGARRELEQTLRPFRGAGGPSPLLIDFRSPTGDEPQAFAWLALCARGRVSRDRPVVVMPTEAGIRRFLMHAADMPGVFDDEDDEP